MNISEADLPSNRKFGYFFTTVFFIAAIYCYWISTTQWSFIFLFTGATFFLVTILNADIFFPLNKMWMKFGYFLGYLINPVIMGIIFFGLITPAAMLMRLMGRDELRLRVKKRPTHWFCRENSSEIDSFRNQF